MYTSFRVLKIQQEKRHIYKKGIWLYIEYMWKPRQQVLNITDYRKKRKSE